MIVVGYDYQIPRNIANTLGYEFIRLERRVFKDGETCPRIMNPDRVKNKEVLLVLNHDRKTFDSNRLVLDTFLTIKNLNSLGCKNIKLVWPFFPYSKQDKVFRPGEPLSAYLLLDMLFESGINDLYCVTLHFEPRQTKLKIHNIEVFDLLTDYLRQMDFKHPFVLGPDEKALRWVRPIAESFNAKYDFLEKFRDKETGELTTMEKELPVKGEDIIILDDWINTGGTMVNAIELLRGFQPSTITCIAVHGRFVGDTLERLKGMGVNVISTNTIESEASRIDVSKKIAGHI
jgi:ribose-phosphate pyrophosphokinase